MYKCLRSGSPENRKLIDIKKQYTVFVFVEVTKK